MKYNQKTKDQLISELNEMRQQIKVLKTENIKLKQLEICQLYYQDIVEGQTELICRLLPDGTHTYVNQACCDYFGKPFKDMIGYNVMEFVPDDDKEEVKNHLASLTLENPVGKIEHRVIMPDGEIRWQQWVDKAIFDQRGELIEFQNVGRDITDRKRTEENLAKVRCELELLVKERTRELEQANEELKKEIIERVWAEERFRKLAAEFEMIFKALPDLYFRYDCNGTYLDCKVGYLNDLFSPVDSFLGKKAQEVLPSPVGKQILSAIHESLKTQTLVKVDYSLTIKSRKQFFEARFLPMTGKQVISVVRNITERKCMEAELIKSRQLESLSILAGGIAHDFNNILMGITGNISLAKRYADPQDKIYEKLIKAEKVAIQAKDLSQQLLTFAKGGEPVRKTAHIGDLIKEAVGFALRGSNIRYELKLAEDLLPVEIDEGQINRVLSNLIINARQAMPGGGTIKVGAQNIDSGIKYDMILKDRKYIRIAIKDEGMGIAEKNLQHIFDPYFTTKPTGSGLGLAIAYSVIKKHGGHIAVESKLSEGTTFYIYLPVSEKEVITGLDLQESTFMGKGTVLVMDDDETILDTTGEMLRYIGYEVAFVRDGMEAIERYVKARESGNRFDAVIMDLTIPGGMGGKEAIKNLLEIDPEVKAIVASGYSSDPVLAEFSKYGYKRCITKPFSMEELSKTLKDVLEINENT